MMSQWPPSPSVEDASTALSHEHVSDMTVQMLKSEDDPVVSRGSVDQYPIIVDSDDQREAIKISAAKPAKRNDVPSEGNSSDDSTGPRTPPPISPRFPTRPSQPSRAKSVSFEEVPKPGNNVGDVPNGRGRPQVTPIDTGLGSDLHSMATGSRRAPSPYSYTRAPTTERTSPINKTTFFPQGHCTASPVQTPMSQQPATQVANQIWNDSGVSSQPRDLGSKRHRSKSRRRDGGSGDNKQRNKESSPLDYISTPQSSRVDATALQHDGCTRPPNENRTMTPPLSRRRSRESHQVKSIEERLTAQATMHSARESTLVRGSPFASPYASSAEETSKRQHNRQNSKHEKEEPTLRRPSSHRKERLHVDDLVDRPQSDRAQTSKAQKSVAHSRAARQQSQHTPITPMTPLTPRMSDAARSMEEYLEQALKDNVRRPRQGFALRTGGSAIASPLPSPPRTPRSERQSTDYTESSIHSQRPSQRSRPPSVDEGRSMELRAHATLLSAATIGAAKAAKASGELPRSGTSSAEHTSGNTTSKPPSATGSRRPSPVFEDPRPPMRSNSYVPTERNHTALPNATMVTEVRPTSRGSLCVLDYTNHPQVQRAFSYAGHEQVRNNTTSAQNCRRDHDLIHNISHIPTYPSIPLSRTRAMEGPKELKPATSNVLILPTCPRSQPTGAYTDWWSIKEMSDIDICPTCVSVLGNTRFRDHFVRSLPRPYNQPSVCAMSKPWLRIAFLQSLRQGKPNLDYMRHLSTLPAGTRACTGDIPDVRMWFDIYDDCAREAIPNFVACSACVRAVDLMFPELENMLTRPKGSLIQEKVCSLNANSKRFPSFIDQLEKAASRCKERRWRANDIQPLVDHIRRVSRYGECPKDRMLTGRTWHFIPDLPEMTICEECYFDVVWPLSDKPIARDVSKTTRPVPTRSNSGISCQLYSERMRRLFREAVAKRNSSQLREVAKTRQGTQQRLVEMNKLYEEDQKHRINRSAEIGRNNAIWRTLE